MYVLARIEEEKVQPLVPATNDFGVILGCLQRRRSLPIQ